MPGISYGRVNHGYKVFNGVGVALRFHLVYCSTYKKLTMKEIKYKKQSKKITSDFKDMVKSIAGSVLVIPKNAKIKFIKCPA